MKSGKYRRPFEEENRGTRNLFAMINIFDCSKRLVNARKFKFFSYSSKIKLATRGVWNGCEIFPSEKKAPKKEKGWDRALGGRI